MHNAETEPKFIFDDFSASKPKQPATETKKTRDVQYSARASTS